MAADSCRSGTVPGMKDNTIFRVMFCYVLCRKNFSSVMLCYVLCQKFFSSVMLCYVLCFRFLASKVRSPVTYNAGLKIYGPSTKNIRFLAENLLSLI